MNRTIPPILVIAFNRPEYLKQLLAVICEVNPTKVYFSVDGPRAGNEKDSVDVFAVRQIIDEFSLDSCLVFKRVALENQGCRKGVKSAIDWFFDNEEEGIVLEDDCIPDKSFFPWTAEMLSLYRDNDRVGLVSGTNFIGNAYHPATSYFFSSFINIWGWATWRRAWRKYDETMVDIDTEFAHGKFRNYFSTKKIALLSLKTLSDFKSNPIDTWDLNWSYTCVMNGFYCLTPSQNLVTNIGYVGSHYSGKTEFNDLAYTPMDLARLRHPKNVELDQGAERQIYLRLKALMSAGDWVKAKGRWIGDLVKTIAKVLLAAVGVDYKKLKSRKSQ